MGKSHDLFRVAKSKEKLLRAGVGWKRGDSGLSEVWARVSRDGGGFVHLVTQFGQIRKNKGVLKEIRDGERWRIGGEGHDKFVTL